jgi:NAD(P)-dependent dehydrogenase (short-subunit alcohol dehydrogenase family)
MQLAGKVALLTGGKRIGAVVADRLAREGVDVALGYANSRIEAERTVTAITALGRRGVAIQADLSRPEACSALVGATATALGRLDILINMASVYVQQPFDELDERGWSACLDVDLKAGFLCSAAAVPYMRQQSGGHIINFSDWAAKSGRPRYRGYLPYYVAKAGVVALTEALALELAPDNILVNAVAPGPILPPPHLSDDEMRAVEESTPLGRWGGEIEIAKVVLALLASDYITGETVRVDGGRHLR